MLNYHGISPDYVKHVPDNQQQIYEAIQEGLKRNILILSGGVSMGDADYVPKVLKELGVQQIFHRIAIKPGKPIWFGVHKTKNTAVFGLPGNPLSCQVTFKLFVETYLRNLLQQPEFTPIQLPISRFKKKKHPLDEFFVCTINENGEVTPKKFNGSGDITASLHTLGFARHLANQKELVEKTLVDFYAWK